MTQSEYLTMIRNATNNVVANKDNIEIPVLSRLRGEISIRVHNRGRGTNGVTRNYRNTYYKKRFKKKDPVGMVKDGDLKRDYGHYLDQEGNNVLGFKEDLSVDKILDEEARRGDTLFNPNDSEIGVVKRELIRRIDREIEREIKRYD